MVKEPLTLPAPALPWQAFDLARKRGFVVAKLRSRRYPLGNTYRNWCHAVGVPNLRIEQVGSVLPMLVSEGAAGRA